MGFGLVTSLNLATLMCGYITVRSKQKEGDANLTIGDISLPFDQGSVFTLTIPLIISSAAPSDPSIYTTMQKISSSSDLKSSSPTITINGEVGEKKDLPTEPNLQSSSSYSSSLLITPHSPLPILNVKETIKKRIMIVEDNAMNMKVLKRMLEKMGFEPECARDGAQAVSKYTESPNYDLILMDLHMPVMDGLTATSVILDMAKGLDRHTKVVAVTSSVSVEVRKDCVASGMSGFIAKPVSVNALVKVMNTIV